MGENEAVWVAVVEQEEGVELEEEEEDPPSISVNRLISTTR